MTALRLPDGDIADSAFIRLLYLLDVVLSKNELKVIANGPADGVRELRWAARYSLALRYLREGNYSKAAEALAEVYDQLGALLAGSDEATESSANLDLFLHPAWVPVSGLGWIPAGEDLLAREHFLAGFLEEQLSLVRRLGQLGAFEDPEARYSAASLIYHNPLLFHNFLWGGSRSRFWQSGYVFDAQQSETAQQRLLLFLKQHNYAWRSYEIFEDLARDEDAPASIRQKALFSAGMSLYRLALYGEEVYHWMPVEELRQKLVETFRRFVETYPESSLADDALLMVGVYGMIKQALEELLAARPNGDKAATARTLLADWPISVSGTSCFTGLLSRPWAKGVLKNNRMITDYY